MDISSIPVLGPALQGLISGTRWAAPIISYNNGDVTAQVFPSLKELCYREGTEFTGDSVDLKLADPEGKFRLTWTLKAAVPLNLALESYNWNYPGERIHRDCGSFEIHRIEIRQEKGGGTTVELAATSIPVSANGRLERKSRAWTKTTLKAIAQQIATDNGLALQYNAKENPKISRADQHDESDFVLLERHAQESDLFVKVKQKTLWIISKEELEHQAPVGTIVCPTPGNPGGVNGQGGIVSWEINETTEDIYKAAEVSFRNNKSGRVVTQSVTDPNAVVGPVHRVKDDPHAEDSGDTNDE